MFLQAITIVLVGFIMGFVYGWKLTLVIIAISPLLMIAGGIMAKVCSFQCSDACYPYVYQPGLLIFRGKKAKFRGIFRGKFAEKSADFAGFSRDKSQSSRNNQPILRDFRGRKVKIRRKIGRFRGILAGKSQFSKDFQGQILRKIGRFHGKFQGETSPRNNQ